jgi:hypothetical protein
MALHLVDGLEVRSAGLGEHPIEGCMSRAYAGLSGEVVTMRRSLAVAVCTWILTLVLRAGAQSFLETLENSRQVMPPLFGWMANGQPVEIPAFTAIVVPMILYAIALAWWRLRLTWPASTGLGLFVGGAAANTSERLAFGGVIDYIPIS